LLDHKRAVRILAKEAVGDALTIGDFVRLDRLDLPQRVRLFKPLAQDVVDDGACPRGLPSAARCETTKVDLGVQQLMNGFEILVTERVRKGGSECALVRPVVRGAGGVSS
jgi:hypothetical protein